MLQKIVAAYKVWYGYLPRFPKTFRYVLGAKVDACFIEVIELLVKASYAAGSKKLTLISSASIRFDVLKFFLQLSWELRVLGDKKYIHLSKQLNESGKLLGGLLKQLSKKETPPAGARGE